MPETKKNVMLSDENGFPVLFAATGSSKEHRKNYLQDVPSTDIVTPDATSGPAEWGRYHDAVREAARSFDSPQEGDIQHFLNARAREPERVDVPAFTEAVHRQRQADLVDVLDHHLRRDGSLPRGARMVRVQAPKGYLRKALRSSSPKDLAHLRHRLTSIGHDQEHVDKYLGDRAKPDMWDQATSYEVRMSDSEFVGLIFDDSDFGFGDIEADSQITAISQAITEGLSHIQPVINIHIDSKENKETI